MNSSRNRSSFRQTSLRIVLGVAFLLLGFFLYLKYGPVPVAVSDSPFPFEKQIVKIPIRARIDRQMESAPFGVSEEVLESVAIIYTKHCSL